MFYIHIQYTKSHILSHVVPTFFASAPTPLFELQAFIFGWLCQKQPYLKDTHYVGTFTSIEHLELIINWVKRHNMSALGCKHILCILTIYVKCEVYFFNFLFFIYFFPSFSCEIQQYTTKAQNPYVFGEACRNCVFGHIFCPKFFTMTTWPSLRRC